MLKRFLQAILLLITLFGAYSLHEGECVRIRAEAAEYAIAMCLPVDLSRPGKYYGQYRKTFAANHGDSLVLDVQPAFQTQEEQNRALTGLTARIVLTDEAGEQIQDDKIEAKAIQQEMSAVWRRGIVGLRVTKTGTYNVAFHVIQPAKCMSGRAQCLVGQSLFCGLEFMPAVLLKAVGVGCWIVAGVVGLLAWAFASPQHRKLQAPTQSAGQTTEVNVQTES